MKMKFFWKNLIIFFFIIYFIECSEGEMRVINHIRFVREEPSILTLDNINQNTQSKIKKVNLLPSENILMDNSIILDSKP
jgi:hypothetical protein